MRAGELLLGIILCLIVLLATVFLLMNSGCRTVTPPTNEHDPIEWNPFEEAPNEVG